MTRETLAQFASVELTNVDCRFVSVPPIVRGRALHSLARYRDETKLEAEWSNNCDIFISTSHETVPFCAAPIGVLVALFPFYDPASLAKEVTLPSVRARLRAVVRSRWHRWKLRQRLRNYQVRTANSEFTRKWTRRRWGIDCDVLYPPVELEVATGEKSNHILSVGRFATGRYSKNQLEMLEAFGSLKKSWPNWHYNCVGARGFSQEEETFFTQAQQRARETGAEVTANVSRTELSVLYREARIFWHATGMKSDESKHPELAEHFGISTVEAMSAGCVPVVVNKGGQPEIVEHGVSGFVWNTVDELREYTARLMADETLWKKMSEAAQRRAQKFSREACVARFTQLLAPHVKLTSVTARTPEAAAIR